MKISLKRFSQGLAVSALVALAAASALANADCMRTTRQGEGISPVATEPKSEAAVSLSDPAIDSLFARYADLHRDAVGYAVADVVSTSMFAKAAPEASNRLTR